MPWKKGESGNPAGRPTGRSKYTRIRLDLEEHLPEAITILMEGVREKDRHCLRIYFDRVCPVLKGVDVPGVVPGFAEAGTLQEKATAILQAVSDGEVSVNDGLSLIQAVANAARVNESSEMERQIEELEKALQEARRLKAV